MQQVQLLFSNFEKLNSYAIGSQKYIQMELDNPNSCLKTFLESIASRQDQFLLTKLTVMNEFKKLNLLDRGSYSSLSKPLIAWLMPQKEQTVPQLMEQAIWKPSLCSDDTSLVQAFFSEINQDEDNMALVTRRIDQILSLNYNTCVISCKQATVYGWSKDGGFGQVFTRDSLISLINSIQQIITNQNPTIVTSSDQTTLGSFDITTNTACYASLAVDAPLCKDFTQTNDFLMDCIRHGTSISTTSSVKLPVDDILADAGDFFGTGGSTTSTTSITVLFDAFINILQTNDVTLQSAINNLLLQRGFASPIIYPNQQGDLINHLDAFKDIYFPVGIDSEIVEFVQCNLPRVVIIDVPDTKSSQTSKLMNYFGLKTLLSVGSSDTKVKSAIEIGLGSLKTPDSTYWFIVLHVIGDYTPFTDFIKASANWVIVETHDDQPNLNLARLFKTSNTYTFSWRCSDVPKSYGKRDSDYVIVASEGQGLVGQSVDLFIKAINLTTQSATLYTTASATAFNVDVINNNQFTDLFTKTYSLQDITRKALTLQNSYFDESKAVHQYNNPSYAHVKDQKEMFRRSAELESNQRTGTPVHPFVQSYIDLLTIADPVQRVASLKAFEKQLQVCVDRAQSDLNNVSANQLQLLQVSTTNIWRHISLLDGANSYYSCIAAQHLLDGFSIELMDGDSIMVNKAWINSIMNSLDALLNTPKVLVISIVGLRGVGKSTLINSMFGTEFKTANVHTKGINIMLVKSKRNEYDYVLLMDSQGISRDETNDQAKANRCLAYGILPSHCTIVLMNGDALVDIQDNLPAAFLSRNDDISLHSKSHLFYVFSNTNESAFNTLRDTTINKLNDNKITVKKDNISWLPKMLDGPEDYKSKAVQLRESIYKRLISSVQWRTCSLEEFSNQLSTINDYVLASDFDFELNSYTDRQNYFIKRKQFEGLCDKLCVCYRDALLAFKITTVDSSVSSDQKIQILVKQFSDQIDKTITNSGGVESQAQAFFTSDPDGHIYQSKWDLYKQSLQSDYNQLLLSQAQTYLLFESINSQATAQLLKQYEQSMLENPHLLNITDSDPFEALFDTTCSTLCNTYPIDKGMVQRRINNVYTDHRELAVFFIKEQTNFSSVLPMLDDLLSNGRSLIKNSGQLYSDDIVRKILADTQNFIDTNKKTDYDIQSTIHQCVKSSIIQYQLANQAKWYDANNIGAKFLSQKDDLLQSTVLQKQANQGSVRIGDVIVQSITSPDAFKMICRKEAAKAAVEWINSHTTSVDRLIRLFIDQKAIDLFGQISGDRMFGIVLISLDRTKQFLRFVVNDSDKNHALMQTINSLFAPPSTNDMSQPPVIELDAIVKRVQSILIQAITSALQILPSQQTTINSDEFLSNILDNMQDFDATESIKTSLLNNTKSYKIDVASLNQPTFSKMLTQGLDNVQNISLSDDDDVDQIKQLTGSIYSIIVKDTYDRLMCTNTFGKMCPERCNGCKAICMGYTGDGHNHKTYHQSCGFAGVSFNTGEIFWPDCGELSGQKAGGIQIGTDDPLATIFDTYDDNKTSTQIARTMMVQKQEEIARVHKIYVAQDDLSWFVASDLDVRKEICKLLNQ